MGAYVVATAGPGNQDFMKKLGADRTIDYTRESFEDAGHFDVVYDGGLRADGRARDRQSARRRALHRLGACCGRASLR